MLGKNHVSLRFEPSRCSALRVTFEAGCHPGLRSVVSVGLCVKPDRDA